MDEGIAQAAASSERVSSSSEDREEGRGGSGGGGSSSEECGGGNEQHRSNLLNQKSSNKALLYRDCSQLPPAAQKKDNNKAGETTTLPASQSLAAKEPTFVTKLFMILSNPAYEDIISWLSHGRSWRIVKQKSFEEKIIPLYFRHGRYSSFARQVNGWGFHRVMQGSDYNSYYHELFLRGLPHLCERMRRLTPKDVASRKTECVVAPDFYALSRDHPLPEPSAFCPMASQPILQQPPAIAAAVAAAAAAAQAGQSGDQFGPILAELEMLEKRRREIVDRIAILAQTQDLGGTGVPAVPVALEASQRLESADSNTNQAGLSNSNTSGSDVAIRSVLASLGRHGGADAASRSQSDGIGSLLQQAGLIALSQQPGGAQLVAQIVQANNQNMLPSPVVPMPDSSAQNALLMLQLLQQIMSQPAPTPQAPPPAAPPSNAQMLEMLMRSISAPSQQASVPLTSATTPGHGTQANAAGGQGINNATVATQQNALLQMLMQAQQQQQQAQAAGHMSSQANNSNNAACGSPQSEQQQMQPANDNNNNRIAASNPSQQNNIQQKQVSQKENSNNAANQQQEQQPQNATQQNAFLQQMQQQMSGGNAAAQQAAFLQMLSAAQQAAAQQQNAPQPDANNIQRQLLEAQLLQSGTLASFLAMSNKNNNNNNPSSNNINNNGQDPKPEKGPGN